MKTELMNTEISSTSTSEVYLYEHSNFQGRFLQFRADAATSQPIDPQLSNQVSSLSVPSGVTVTLTDSQSGISVTFTESAAYVGNEINDRADTVAIIPQCDPDSGVC